MRQITDGSSNFYFPGAEARDAERRRRGIAGRKTEFAELNELARACGDGWLVSVPGDFEVRVECLPSSDLPQRLQRAGYELRPDGQGERILGHAITERFGRAANGELVPLTPGSPAPIVHRVTHAGIVGVQRYSFLL